MTRRERLEERLEKRQQWADKREQEAAARFAGVRRIADAIPFGQPILVGHHSERHARAYQRRIHNGMRAAVDALNMAQHHTSKAAALFAVRLTHLLAQFYIWRIYDTNTAS